MDSKLSSFLFLPFTFNPSVISWQYFPNCNAQSAALLLSPINPASLICPSQTIICIISNITAAFLLLSQECSRSPISSSQPFDSDIVFFNSLLRLFFLNYSLGKYLYIQIYEGPIWGLNSFHGIIMILVSTDHFRSTK